MSKPKQQIIIDPETSLWKGARLTDRDIAILKFVNDFGYCEMPHIEKRFEVRGGRSYQLTKKLKCMGLLIHQYLLPGHGFFRLTKNGARHTSLPRLNAIQLDAYAHHVTLINLYFHAKKYYPNARWISERQLIHSKNKDGVGKTGHLPDAVLEFSHGNKIAIEVELTLKGKDRLNDILKSYLTDTDFKEVWYYASSRVRPSLLTLAEDYPFVKIHDVEEFLP
jgi:hypothetical protein